MRLSHLLIVSVALACEREQRTVADDLSAASPASAKGAASANLPKQDEAAEDEREVNTLATIFKILSLALEAKVRCPEAVAWVGALPREVRTDGWGRPFRAECRGENLVVQSAGKDGVHGNFDDSGYNLRDYARPIIEPPREKVRRHPEF